MLGKRTRPAIGKLAGAIRSSVIDHMTSPRSPLECKMHSPRTLKMYDQSGFGLGLAVALDKPTNVTGGCRGEVLAKYAICGQFSTRSNPIPVSPSGQKDIKGCNSNDIGKFSRQVMVEMELPAFDEEFTYVTCHGPNKSTTTRVYYDGGEFGKFSQTSSGELKISPVRSTGDRLDLSSESELDFLSSCHLCRKTLHGKDIYMYRGEKAFCSTECRQRQIGMDERKEKRRSSEITRPTDHLATSPCNYSGRSQIFFSAGIIAA